MKAATSYFEEDDLIMLIKYYGLKNSIIISEIIFNSFTL